MDPITVAISPLLIVAVFAVMYLVDVLKPFVVDAVDVWGRGKQPTQVGSDYVRLLVLVFGGLMALVVPSTIPVAMLAPIIAALADGTYVQIVKRLKQEVSDAESAVSAPPIPLQAISPTPEAPTTALVMPSAAEIASHVAGLLAAQSGTKSE